MEAFALYVHFFKRLFVGVLHLGVEFLQNLKFELLQVILHLNFKSVSRGVFSCPLLDLRVEIKVRKVLTAFFEGLPVLFHLTALPEEVFLDVANLLKAQLLHVRLVKG